MRYPVSMFLLVFLLFCLGPETQAQRPAQPQYGPHDTILVSAIYYDNEWMPYSEMDMVYISNVPPEKLAKIMAAYNRLRNAVYVTYPYAKAAGSVINDVNAHLQSVSKGDRKKYIKSREAELKKQFSDPLSNLSVYQGKVLMKLINRETGNDCYELIREYRGGLNARMYQTVAFFFGSSLKQDYNAKDDPVDRQIEAIVQEINGSWYNNPYKPGIAPGR
ncbi:MAG TPA: DUF4294 domain-containing protein [Flavisolibacter sp.]|nr:DUF4294 domain-containing protein [Flavisolibacter sp.]